MIQAHLGIPFEPCACEATPGNTELSNREIIDKDKHPVAETTRSQKFACGITITTVHPCEAYLVALIWRPKVPHMISSISLAVGVYVRSSTPVTTVMLSTHPRMPSLPSPRDRDQAEMGTDWTSCDAQEYLHLDGILLRARTLCCVGRDRQWLGEVRRSGLR